MTWLKILKYRKRNIDELGLPIYGTAVSMASISLGALTLFWRHKITSTVPEPYLDEFFHVRQTQVYCARNFSQWDPKITTPPGLYIISYILNYFGAPCDIATLRLTNAVILPTGIFLLLQVLLLRHDSYDRMDSSKNKLNEPTVRRALLRTVHTAVNISLFPPLFFFSGLYYTDVASTAVVLLFLEMRNDPPLAKVPFLRDVCLVLVGIIALFFRQTNIFWVGVFPAGLDVVDVLKRKTKEVKTESAGKDDSFYKNMDLSLRGGQIYDLPLHEAYSEDYLKTVLSITASAATNIGAVVLTLVPYITLMGLFAVFVFLNGGVVLGDKSNHVTTINTPQMLYVWPYIIFFSFPNVLPRILPSLLSPNFVPGVMKPYLTAESFRPLPRLFLIIIAVVAALTAIHYNTIIHPFTLADNRHYVFYVFRILRMHSAIRYLAAPVYIFCAWAVFQALEGPSPIFQGQSSLSSTRPTFAVAEKKSSPEDNGLLSATTSTAISAEIGSATTSYTILWLLTTTLTLITTPLVEPRYFILPWIFWRLAVPSIDCHSNSKPSLAFEGTPLSVLVQNATERNSHPSGIEEYVRMYDHGDLSLWAETIWLVLVNGVTGYMFLYRGFEWVQEPGVVQRFMW